MVWPIPEYSKSQIVKAGKLLASKEYEDLDEFSSAIDILSNWRACHGYPINTFQSTLRDKLKKITDDYIVAQRLKRLPSIIKKLERYPTMSLALMQDIGGLRAVVSTMKQVEKLKVSYTNTTRMAHELIRVDDYIQSPKTSGYRSIHLVYRYKNHKKPIYNGLKVEVQLRTKLQHAWATAVETLSTVLDQSLKSSQGDIKWLEYFELISSAFAHIENTALIKKYSHLNKEETFSLIKEQENLLNIKDKLLGYGTAIQHITEKMRPGSSYYLITLNKETRRLNITPYNRTQLQQAAEDYKEAEVLGVHNPKIESVLVSAGSIQSIKKAYPNYFLDTKEFVAALQKIII